MGMGYALPAGSRRGVWEMSFIEIRDVNEAINQCAYTSNVEPLWKPIDDGGGTCSNYAVAKYRRLAELGYPLTTLRLATCWVTPEKNPLTDYHAVLWVDYDGKTWELSNGMPVRDAAMSPWEYDKIQIAGTDTWEKA